MNGGSRFMPIIIEKVDPLLTSEPLKQVAEIFSPLRSVSWKNEFKGVYWALHMAQPTAIVHADRNSYGFLVDGALKEVLLSSSVIQGPRNYLLFFLFLREAARLILGRAVFEDEVNTGIAAETLCLDAYGRLTRNERSALDQLCVFIEAKAGDKRLRMVIEAWEQVRSGQGDKVEAIARYVNNCYGWKGVYDRAVISRCREFLLACNLTCRATGFISLIGHSDRVGYCMFSADGKLALTASDDGTARIWNDSGRCIQVLRGHETWVGNCDFSADGKRVVTASGDKTARIWDVHSGSEVLSLRGHEDAVWAARFSTSGSSIVTGSEDCTARIWCAHTGSLLRILRGHGNRVREAVFSSDGALVATASSEISLTGKMSPGADHTAKLWDASSGQLLRTLQGHQGGVRRVSFFNHDRCLYTTGTDNTVRVWDLTGKCLNVVFLDRGAWQGAMSPEGEVVASGTEEHVVKIYRLSRGRGEKACVKILRGHSAQVNWVCWSPDGKRLLSASQDYTARIWLIPEV